jgi:hypothetical protein
MKLGTSFLNEIRETFVEGLAEILHRIQMNPFLKL